MISISTTPSFDTVNATEIFAETIYASNVYTKDNVKFYGAVGDGVTDDYVALQAALNARRAIYVPPGVYCTTQELVFLQASKLYGNSYQVYYNQTTLPNGVSVIKWCGAANSSGTVLRLSISPVGVEPGSNYINDTLWNVGVTNLVVDANNATGFGIYMVRASLLSPMTNIVVMGATRFGFWGNLLWSTQFQNIMARLNYDVGFAIGLNIFGWSASAVHAVSFDTISGSLNGLSKTYDEVTNPTGGCGIYLVLGRGNTATLLDAELNDGPGIVLQYTSGPNHITGGYTEGNNYDSVTTGRSSRAWGIWLIGSLNGLYNTISHVFMNAAGNITRSESIRLTGTSPSSGRYSGAVVLERLYIGGAIVADWAAYRLDNCAPEMSLQILGVLPGAPSIQAPGSAALPNFASSNSTTTGIYFNGQGVGLSAFGTQTLECGASTCVFGTATGFRTKATSTVNTVSTSPNSDSFAHTAGDLSTNYVCSGRWGDYPAVQGAGAGSGFHLQLNPANGDVYIAGSITGATGASLRVARIGNAVNRALIQGSAAGGSVTYAVEGNNTDIGAVFQSKGAGNVVHRVGGVTKFSCSPSVCTTGTATPLQQSGIQVIDTITCTGLTCVKSANVYTLTLSVPISTPANSSVACTAGAMALDASFIYACVATNTWRRTAISNW